MDKCDLLKEAYTAKSLLLDSTLTVNITLFEKLEQSRAKELQYQDALHQVNDKLLKQRNSILGNIPAFLAGTAIGGIVALLLVLL